MEKHNSSNTFDFDATSPQQILNNTPIKIEGATTTNNHVYNNMNETDVYLAQKHQNGISVLGNEPWSDYRNNNIVSAEFFPQGNIIPLLNNNNLSENNPTAFDNLYQQQVPSNDYQEQQFNYTHHRGSLPIINHSVGLLNSSSTENISATVDSVNMRRYTEGSIPKYKGRKQRMNSVNSVNSSSNKGEDETFLNSEELKRKQFLERNRQAALKCRQRKKQWLANLQQRVELLTTDNEQLQSQATLLREEVLNLKTLLLAHRDCKVAQANGTTINMIQNVSSLNQNHKQERYTAVPNHME